MTTMDSDSESQDSDEGRRFRFEATRKDATASLRSRKRKLSPSRTNARHRLRSRERDYPDRRSSDKPRKDHVKESQKSSDVNSFSKDHDTKYLKDNNDATRSSSRYKDNRNSRNPSSHKKLNICRESSLKKSRKDSRLCENDKRRSHNHSTDRNYDGKPSEKHTKICQDRRKLQSRERSREQSHQVCSTKMSHAGRSNDDGNKNKSLGKMLRKDDKGKNVSDEDKNIEKGNIVSKANSKSRSSSPSSKQECKDLNLSDFDILSDTEENSSDNSGSKQGSKESIRVENILPYDCGSSTKKRLSKHQYERLLNRQVVTKGSKLQELEKVGVKNVNQLLGNSNNNRSAVPNFTLGASATILTDPDLPTSTICQKEISSYDYSDIQSMKIGSDHSNSSGPRNAECEESIRKKREEDKNSVLKETGMLPVAPRIIGPTLPSHLRQSIENTEKEMEDTFGPALPPHLALKNVVDKNSEEQDLFPICSVYDTNKSESTETILSASEGEDNDVVGPLPSDHPALEDDLVQQQLECRARRLKMELAMCVSLLERRLLIAFCKCVKLAYQNLSCVTHASNQNL